MHHSDPDFDVSTAVRFHPLETILVQGANLAFIWALAPPLAAVVASEVLAAGINFVEHANATFPAVWERRLRSWIVTPSLHRIHHSEQVTDQLKNFGQYCFRGGTDCWEPMRTTLRQAANLRWDYEVIRTRRVWDWGKCFCNRRGRKSACLKRQIEE